MELVSASAAATAAIGRWLGQQLWPGSFVALVGEMGAGKTALAQGILAGLGIRRSGGSPTFPLLWEYPEGRLPTYHWDVYRVEHPDELEDLGYADSFYGEGICIVEWADRVRNLWPREYLEVTLTPGDAADARCLHLRAEGARYLQLLEGLDRAGLGA